MESWKEEKIARLQKEMKSLKAKIDAMNMKKDKGPFEFSQLEKMQLQNNIAIYNELADKLGAVTGKTSKQYI